ncbi:MAG: NUDIX hydrolase [Thermoproteota archaeon]
MKRKYPTGPVLGVGGVVIWKGRILLEERKFEPSRGKWSIPGGVVELGESPEQSVIREVEEETNLQVCNPQLLDVVNSVTVDGKGEIEYHFVVIDYFVKLKGGILKAADDARQVRWVDLAQVESYNLPESFRKFFHRNKQRLVYLNSVEE